VGVVGGAGETRRNFGSRYFQLRRKEVTGGKILPLEIWRLTAWQKRLNISKKPDASVIRVEMDVVFPPPPQKLW